MPYRIGESAPLDDDDNCKTLFGYDPRSIYNPGAERLLTLAGTTVDVGYPRSVWTFAVLGIELWEDLLDMIGGYSGEIYVETRDDVDTWYQYRALARLPEPRTLDRWGNCYRNVEILLVLLEDVTPV
jgi:hypothetical protein